MIKNLKIMLIRILLLFLGGASFFFFHNWLILPTVGIIWFLFELYTDKERNKKYWNIAILFGIILMISDFAFENWGAVYGYWRTIDSNFFVMAVPIEIMLTCIFGGAAWFLFATKYNNKMFVIINLILWSIGGMAGEADLMEVGFMNYGNGWMSIPHAFVSYLIMFVIFYYLSSFMVKKFKIKA